jgi:hypothetical protein
MDFLDHEGTPLSMCFEKLWRVSLTNPPVLKGKTLIWKKVFNLFQKMGFEISLLKHKPAQLRHANKAVENKVSIHNIIV